MVRAARACPELSRREVVWPGRGVDERGAGREIAREVVREVVSEVVREVVREVAREVCARILH